MALERKRESFFPPLDYDACSRRENLIRWCESDVPWSRLNDEGETESEGIDDCDEDDDQDD